MRSPLAVLALAAALAGCAGGDSRREAVEDYVARANQVQARFEPGLRAAQSAIQAFAAGRTGSQTSARLGEASATLRSARATLAVVEPPAEARSLHGHLLELLDVQARLTRELSLAARYLPDAVDTLRPVDAAGAELGRELRAATDGRQQVAALERYGGAVATALERLGRLAPPPVLRPWNDEQARRLRASRSFATRLTAAIRQRDQEALEEALGAFPGGAGQARQAERAQADAVDAFNDLLAEQDALLDTIAREQAQLAERVSG